MINLLGSVIEAVQDHDLPITYSHGKENSCGVIVWDGSNPFGWVTIRHHDFNIPRTQIPLEVFTVQSSRLEDNYDDNVYQTLNEENALQFFVDEIYNLLP